MNRAVPLPERPDVVFAPLTDVTLTRITRPLRAPFRTALREVRELTAWRLDVTTADGETGSGTTVATPQISGDTDDDVRTALETVVREATLGRTSLREVTQTIAGCSAGPAARAAADLAVHDLGRRTDDLATLLTGRPAGDDVPTDVTISVDTPEAMASAAAQRIRDGFGVLKAKLADPDLDAARVRAVCDVARESGVVVRVDPNQSWTADAAVRLLDSFADDGIELELVEQPLPADDLDGMAFVTRRSPYPVLADESVFTADDVRRVADAGAANLVNLKLLKCGGLGPARDVVQACHDAGLGLIIGCMLEPAEGIAAATTLAQVATSGPLAHDLDAAWWAATA